VDIEYLQAVPPVKKEKIILMTGFMSDPANEDGVHWFYNHVWPGLRKRYPDLHFYIVGAGAGSRILKIGEMDDRITVTGQVEDLRPYRNLASVFVSPVRLGSGMRTKVLEAMAGGLPVVSTSLGVAGLEAQTGVNCLVADTPELFTRSVEWLLNDDELAHQLAENAKELVKKKYTLEEGLQRFEKILNSVVKG
jgi:glycosyltransferase involved in cell wall biosynthesis